MTTVELATRVPCHVVTIRRMARAEEIDFTPIGGRHGHEYPEDAVRQVRDILRQRHAKRKGIRQGGRIK